ncbi:MAG: cellulase family glycosylhydrolase [Acidimicrobiales bacterium]
MKARRRASVLLVTVAVLALTALAPTAVPPAHAAPSDYVSAAGGDLYLRGQLWRPVGFNNYRLTSLPGGFACDYAIDDAALATRLDQMRSAGANAVRTWFFQRYWEQGPAANPWAPFDRLLTAAAARGMKVIPALVNQWNDCEHDVFEKNHGFYASAYQSPGFGYARSFRDWAVMVATRYATNATVAFWQLANEAQPSYCSDTSRTCSPGTNPTYQCPGDAAAVLRAFADDMTARLKAVDANHLVSLGTIGSGQCGAQEDQYRHVHAGAVDVCEVHDYNHAAAAVPGDQWNGFALRLSQCQGLGKPIFVGEAGIRADVGQEATPCAITGESLARRARYFDAKMAAQFAAGMDGFLIWEKILEASDSAANRTGECLGVGPGDPVEPFTKVWGGANASTINGFTWSTDGGQQPSGPRGSPVRAYATGLARGTSFRLVSAPQSGNEQHACRHNVVPINAAVRVSSASGFVGATVGVIDRPAGTWQICFRGTTGTAVGFPMVFQVT